jgi:hypothetical protein
VFKPADILSFGVFELNFELRFRHLHRSLSFNKSPLVDLFGTGLRSGPGWRAGEVGLLIT